MASDYYIIETFGDAWEWYPDDRKATREARRSIKDDEWSAIRVTDATVHPMRYVWGAWWEGDRLVETTDLEELHQMTAEHRLLDYANWDEDEDDWED